MKTGYLYILANKNNNVLYTGVTSNIQLRVHEHKEGKIKGFTKKYNVNKLVYLEGYDSILAAIEREKQIKGGSRKKKEELISNMNPEYKDLYLDLF